MKDPEVLQKNASSYPFNVATFTYGAGDKMGFSVSKMAWNSTDHLTCANVFLINFHSVIAGS